MKRLVHSVLATVTVATVIFVGPTVRLGTAASAAQPWYCLCKTGTTIEKKRFLASTRHCEYQMNLPKGQVCSRDQMRAVYGPACKSEGCTIAPFE